LDEQEEMVHLITFRYITDSITEEEALQLLKEKDAGKKEREAKARGIEYASHFPRKSDSHNEIF